MYCLPLVERRPRYGLLALAVILSAAFSTLAPAVRAQNGPEDPAGPSAAPPPLPASEPGEPLPEAASQPDRQEIPGINFFALLIKGGVFIVPILLMSMLVVTFAIERALGLRKDKILPDELVLHLGELGRSPAGFDPRQAYRLCQRIPSAASNVIRAMLLKVGRPHSEVEHAVSEASEREAERIYANVRWLNLAAVVTPLMGLLGTVWGMIRAFHDTTQLAPGQNKADYLAEGIYVALVTTLAGLSVAIPAAILSHYFEGRITKAFHQIDELLFNLLPQIERYEGRVRFGQGNGSKAAGTSRGKTDAAARDELPDPKPPPAPASPARTAAP